MPCVHRLEADVRWRILQLFVLISVAVLPALADDASTTVQATSEAVTTNPLVEIPTLSTRSTSAFNETSTLKPPEGSTKSVDVPTEILEGKTERSEVEIPVISDAETAGKQEGIVEKRQVTNKKRVETQNETTDKSAVAAGKTPEPAAVEKKNATNEAQEETQNTRTKNGGVTAEMAGEAQVTLEEEAVPAEKRDVTEERVEITTEKLQDEESQTESASELALQSVQLAVVVRAPKRHGEKISSGNSTDEVEEDDEYGGFEGGDDNEEDMEDDDGEHGMIEYEEEEEEEEDMKSPSEVPPTVMTLKVMSSTAVSSTKRSPSTASSLTSATSPDDKLDVELIKEVTTAASTSTSSGPRRPRHSQSGDYDYGIISTTTLRPRRPRPNRYKDERRVPYRDGYYPGRSLKRKKTTKGRPLKPTTILAPIQTTTENYRRRFNNHVDLEQDTATEKAVPTTPQVPRRRPKRRKKKVRRQKQNKSQERQVPAETRAAIEAAAAAAAVESLGSDALPSASTTVSTERLPTTYGPRSVRQNGADVSIQQSVVNPDGSYSFRYVVDEGRQERTEDGSPDQVVKGRYSFTDANGRAVEREYSAGPRGFRATGTDIARKMDLSQLGPAPVPPPDGRYSPEYDGYSDPNEDPSYKFQYQTDTAYRDEEADSRGDVKGQYSYIDDDGEKHVVRYYAGAEKGFNVKSAFPDNRIPPALFFPGRGRIPPRGRSSILQHRNGAYRFTAVGPDSRREECSDSMNYRRGSYVYLDDKGVQRTVVYEAGPNIGFRIIPNAAAIPRCPPSKGSPGWQNIPVQVGVDPPYYDFSNQGFGALPPTSTWPYPPSSGLSTASTVNPWISTTRSPTAPPWKKPETNNKDGKTTTYRPDVTNPPKPPKRRPPPPTGTPSTTHNPHEDQPCPKGNCSVVNGLFGGPSWSPGDNPNPSIGSTREPPTTPQGLPPGNRVVTNPKFDELFNRTFPGQISPAPLPGGDGRPPGDGKLPDGPRPLPKPYPPYHFSCCRDRLFVDSALDDHVGRARPIRTYVQSIDLSEDDENRPGRAENPSVALERHVREHELKASRRQRRRRRRRRRSAP